MPLRAKPALPRTILLFLATGVMSRAPANDWPTFGGDPQRTGWARQEVELSAKTAARLRLMWTFQLESASKEMTGPTVPIVVHVFTGNQVRDIVVAGGASDDLSPSTPIPAACCGGGILQLKGNPGTFRVGLVPARSTPRQ